MTWLLRALLRIEAWLDDVARRARARDRERRTASGGMWRCAACGLVRMSWGRGDTRALRVDHRCWPGGRLACVLGRWLPRLHLWRTYFELGSFVVGTPPSFRVFSLCDRCGAHSPRWEAW